MRLDLSPYLSQKFLMPAETERHSACWMAWPVRTALWGDRLAAAQTDFATVARAIARFEPVHMVCREQDVTAVREQCGDAVTPFIAPIDDSWMRDSGPTFVRGSKGGLAVVNWAFNAWGRKYHPYAADAALKRRMAEQLGLPLVTCPLTAEGGAILSDGEGTVITTESCLLHANRNLGLTRAQVEAELLAALGAEKIVWLPGDAAEVETDGHVDCLAAVVRPGVVMMEDPATASGARAETLAANRAALLAQRDARGRPFAIIDLPAAPTIDPRDARHQPSYVNFYIANGAVIMPGHGVPQDDAARAAVAAAFPDRAVVQLVLPALPYGGGSIHCITQHQPAPHFLPDGAQPCAQ
ncbi:agmatine/peptidylarginine deiminase [Novosphingobium sp. AAP1]|uniref:agmatine deiminase family protein n=1 Tax=Novosphingobium sp. AAP1 TaxID=1523413 RepID=UPI000A461537|nr:agmatine deiminase family protein [Novosphingobium sp. AAP1]